MQALRHDSDPADEHAFDGWNIDQKKLLIFFHSARYAFQDVYFITTRIRAF